MITIKHPACYDISHWKEVDDFAAVNPRPLLFITKATEHITYVDEKFARFFAGMKSIGCRRGVYHFHRRAFDPRQQAQHFCNVIRPHVTNDDILILDVEEGGETASQLWAWFEEVRRQYPNNLLMIYSRANILNAIPMTAGEREYFKKIPTWTAGYPEFPDLWDAPLSGYIPDQTKWGPVWLWQYSAHGAVTGIEGDVDLNWMHPALIERLGNGELPQPEGETTMQYKVVWGSGVTKRTGPTTSAPSLKDGAGASIVLPPNLVFDVAQDGIADQTYPTDINKRWVKFTDGSYGASDYPDSTGPKQRMVKVSETLPPAETFPSEISLTIAGVSKTYVLK